MNTKDLYHLSDLATHNTSPQIEALFSTLIQELKFLSPAALPILATEGSLDLIRLKIIEDLNNTFNMMLIDEVKAQNDLLVNYEKL